MIIPEFLKKQILRGQVVLFLGSGASIGALNKNGEQPPNGQELANMLSKEFLGGKYKDNSLQIVSELAVSASDLITVQEFIRSKFEDFEPANFHLLMPTFKWHGIATTNFDLVIEKSYRSQKERLQEAIPLLGNSEKVDDKLRDINAVLLLKLHGCISRTKESNLPLILTPEQYINYRSGRDRLFLILEEWGYEHPIVFIGYGLQDYNLRQILLNLSKLETARPRYYLVTPSITEEEEAYWQSKRIQVLNGTFEEFLQTLNEEIPYQLRSKGTGKSVKHPIETRFNKKDVELSDVSNEFLFYESYYIHEGLPVEEITPKAFYKGINKGFAPIVNNLDVRRNLIDIILSDIVIVDESERPTNTELYVIKAEAGAGKTVALKRIAWDSAIEWDHISIYFRPHYRLTYEPLYELSYLIGERIFLFIDNAADHVFEIEDVLTKARKDNLPLTIITAERINEWNMGCEQIDRFVSGAYNLHYLKSKEIEVLVDLLEKHDSLGHLENETREERIEAFKERAGRQLLVALHEATQGKPFEEILVDEFNEIKPREAQSLYLSVCILNRLRVPIRAGLISRVHGINFTDFKERLFKPLEHVVQVRFDHVIKDYLYSARHSEIAEIVFERILKSPDDRFREYTRMLSSMNNAYNTDRKAFRYLTQGRTLLKLFPDHDAVIQIFKIAFEVSPNDSYLYHQRGLYEMNRANGNLNDAHSFLSNALKLTKNEYDPSIIHSLAELARIRAKNSRTNIEKEKYIEETKKLASLILNERNGSYGYHTLLKLSIEKLQDTLFGEKEVPEHVLENIIGEIESLLQKGLQAFPEDPYLLGTESDFRELIKDQERAFNALEKAFRVNQRNPYIANRLAKAYYYFDDCKNAIDILEKAVNTNRGNHQLNYSLAKMLIDCGIDDVNKKLYHLKRSFTKGDKNYDAQFWYATYLFISGQPEQLKESKLIFKYLREIPMSYDLRTKIRTMIMDNDKPKSFLGHIAKKESSYAFIERYGPGDLIFTHSDHLFGETFNNIKVGDQVKFIIGFNFGGPIALDINVV